MATKGQLVSDIELRLTKGSVSDDFEVDRRQIAFWLDNVRSALMYKMFKESGSTSLESFLKVYDCLDIQKRVDTCDSDCKEMQYYVSLPVSPVDVQNDLGLYRVETLSGKTISRIRLSERSRIKNVRFGKPSKSNIAYWRVGKEITIEGGTNSFKDGGKIAAYIIPQDSSDIDDSEEYPIESSLIADLLNEAEAIGRRELEMPEDISNDGKQAE